MVEHAGNSESKLRCVIVTPERTVVDTPAESVVLPMFDGAYGVLTNHSPLIGRLGFGELRIHTFDGGQQRFFADGGFVQVADNVVSVLTNRAVPPESLNAAAAGELLKSAMAHPAAGDEALAIRARSIAQARGQLRVASRR